VPGIRASHGKSQVAGGGAGVWAYRVPDRPGFSTDQEQGATLDPQQPGSEPGTEQEGARVSRRKVGFWYRLAAALAKPPLVVLLKRDWRGLENMPATGGFITVVNHNSQLDPFAYGHFQYNTGRVPRFLAKSGLFTKGFVGRVMRGTGQIPVYRESTDALSAFRAAIDAVERGECVAFYPEGTLTRDPDLWPMTGKTGAARVALGTRCPVVPIAQWGANLALPPYSKHPRFFPRKTHQVLVGKPVDLSRFYDLPMTPEVLREATDVIMWAITHLLAEVRGEPAPARLFDRRRIAEESPDGLDGLDEPGEPGGIADLDGDGAVEDPADAGGPSSAGGGPHAGGPAQEGAK
jgi:1-acyl-sn-glycerol-3-phosphate acyltransferase